MKRVLFVDDDPEILAGLRAVSHRYRSEWQACFADSGEAALKKLAQHPFDVLVSDMRMPGMDGAELMRHAHQDHPETVRIVLSGYADQEASMQALPVAHQFLLKPCNPQVLSSVIQRACDLQALISKAAVREVVGGVTRLPSVPRVYAELNRALARPDIQARDIAAIVEQDVAISAKVLQLVNSAFLRTAREIHSIEQAVVHLGTNTIKQLALSVEVFSSLDDSLRGRQSALQALQAHSMQVARIALALSSGARARESAFTAALLHDIGKVVLWLRSPGEQEDWAQQCAVRDEDGESAPGPAVTHAEVGGYLLGIWGLPYPIVEAVANHHVPGRVASSGFDALTAVHVANGLVNESCQERVGDEEKGLFIGVDEAYLAKIGCADQLDSWRDLCDALLEGE